MSRSTYSGFHPFIAGTVLFITLFVKIAVTLINKMQSIFGGVIASGIKYFSVKTNLELGNESVVQENIGFEFIPKKCPYSKSVVSVRILL